jgi:DNA-binding transcriptional LysR family regulator
MPWSLIAPVGHPVLSRRRIELRHLVDEPLVTYERGSLSHQLVLEAFHRCSLSPKIGIETSNSDLIVRIVEAGLGIGVVPWLESGIVTQGRKVDHRNLGDQIRPLDMGVLTRKGEDLSEPTRHFIEFMFSDELLRRHRMNK